MGKQTQQERAQNYLGRNSKVTELFGTSDGFLFEKRVDSLKHSRTLKNPDIKRFTETGAEKVDLTSGIEPGTESQFLKNSVKAIREELPEMNDVEELEGYLAEEKAKTDARSTAVEAIENRIKDLKNPE